MILRKYQQDAIDLTYQWMIENNGNPCIVLPTGAGKSHCIAALCKDVVQRWPGSTILMLSHVKELIEQNADKMALYWPDAPIGIYSAGMKKKEIGRPIIFASIQSVRNKATELGSISLLLVDEAHFISHKDTGGYRNLINDLLNINPDMRVIGFTASPYRLGHGLITDKPAIFDTIIEPATITDLIAEGYLSTLRSKKTESDFDLSFVRKRGGEYIEADLQKAVDKKDKNASITTEMIARAGDRQSWLVFCSGGEHAQHISDELNERGILSKCVFGDTPMDERSEVIEDFKNKKIRALCNVMLFTTGTDFPDIDMIAMLRPTMSPGLYLQMAGRGMRVKSHTDHCLVLDFAGNVATHGPITNIKPPEKKGGGNGDAPVKVCDSCSELCHISAKICPCCGAPFPEPVKKKLKIHDDDIMGIDVTRKMQVSCWEWSSHIGKKSGKEVIKIDYYKNMYLNKITEYLPVFSGGYYGQKAMEMLSMISRSAGLIGIFDYKDLDSILKAMGNARPPSSIEYRVVGKYPIVTKRLWE